MTKPPAPQTKGPPSPRAPKAPPKPVQPKAPQPKTKPAHKTKTFTAAPWHGANEGEKVLVYSSFGKGKTTLVALAPDPRYIGADDGGRKIKNGITGEHITHIPGIECFEDVRDALHQDDLWPTGSTVVLDTLTKIEEWSEAYVLATIATEKGALAKNLEAYGYNKGYKHCLDAMRLILQDLDALIRRGVNVILICQQQAVRIANAEGADYLQDGPKLYHNNQHSTRLLVCEWVDHIVQIDYLGQVVETEGNKTTGKVTGSADRVIRVCPENPSHVAKSRTLGNMKYEDETPITKVSFESPADDTLWQFIFPRE